MQKEYKGKLPIKGEIYGSLTLTGNYNFVHQKGGRRLFVEAICKCGEIKDYAYRFLTNMNTSSCGCVRKERIREVQVTHNLSKHPLYSVYKDMIRRCYDINCKAYKDYDGRGIIVCDEWKNDIFAFRHWAMNNGYEIGLQLDREINDGNYEPNNCRFVTKDVNNKNTRRNVFITAFGETKIATDWSKDFRCVVNKRTLLGRFSKPNQWTKENAIITPANATFKEIQRNNGSARQLKAFGEEKSMIEWSEDSRCKIGYSGLKIRLKKGWDIEDAISHPILRKNKTVIAAAR
jgi:hypothetical protein